MKSVYTDVKLSDANIQMKLSGCYTLCVYLSKQNIIYGQLESLGEEPLENVYQYKSAYKGNKNSSLILQYKWKFLL